MMVFNVVRGTENPYVLMFSVLGSIEIRGVGQILRPRRPMRQTLLAAFLAAENKLVSVDVLAEELWGTTPPAKMENALQAQISRLRRALHRLEPENKAERLTTNVAG